MTTEFWGNYPSILLRNDYITEIIPNDIMNLNQKINALTRLLILIILILTIITRSIYIIIFGIMLIISLYIGYKLNYDYINLNTSLKENIENIENKENKENKNEGFLNMTNDNSLDNLNGNTKTQTQESSLNSISLTNILNSEFKEGTKKNPFSNVLLTDIMDDPNKKPAPPAFNPDVEPSITKNVKSYIQMLNPGLNVNKQIFGSLWDKFELDQSNRVFYSTPNTKVVNDQGAYSQFLYNNMKYSGKESTPEGAFARVQDNWRYIMI